MRSLRHARGMTQEQLAEQLDVTIQWLRSIETGREMPGLVTLAKLAITLGVDLPDLLAEEI